MIHTYLIIGNTAAARHSYIHHELTKHAIHPIDQRTLTCSQKHIGISDVREFIKTLSLAPMQSPFISGVIHEADNLTLEASQALLKTLEEPPPRALLFLGASRSDVLLPTIVSRSMVIHCKDTTLEETLLDINPSLSPAALLIQLAALGKTKEEYGSAYDQVIRSLRASMVTTGNVDHAHILHDLIMARHLLSNNIHPLLLMEHILLDKATPIRYNDF